MIPASTSTQEDHWNELITSEAAVNHMQRCQLQGNGVSLFCHYGEEEQDHKWCLECLCLCHTTQSIEELFKGHPALGTLIVPGDEPDTYRLNL